MTADTYYVKGFNHGYMLSKHLPELFERLVKGITSKGRYECGVIAGSKEFEKELSGEKFQKLIHLRQKSVQKQDLNKNR